MKLIYLCCEENFGSGILADNTQVKPLLCHLDIVNLFFNSYFHSHICL